MTMLLAILLIGSFPVSQPYRPDRDGASTTVAVQVVDTQGTPIQDAKVFFRVFTTLDKCYKLLRDTDANGFCEITGKTRGEITVVVDREGYYTSYGNLAYRDLSWEDAVAERKWTRGVVTNKVVMKQVVAPRKMLVKGMRFKKPPKINAPLPFDVAAFDWVDAGCRGHKADFDVVYYEMINEANRVRTGLKLTATNCVDGFMLKKVDEWSRFRYDLSADAKGAYVKEIKMGWIPDQDGGTAYHSEIDRDCYLIFRLRTATNECGKIMHSNYGLLFEGIDYHGGLSLGAKFNPEDNDTSLEDDWAYWNMKKGR